MGNKYLNVLGFLFGIFLNHMSLAQNLIQDGGFELNVGCAHSNLPYPQYFNWSMKDLLYWNQPTSGTSDFYNPCNPLSLL